MSSDGGHSSREMSAPDTGDTWRRRGMEWVLLDGDRITVAVVFSGLLLGIFGSLFALNAVPLLDVQALFYVFSGLIAGNLTLITVVVSINQLLLSRQIQTPGELRTQIQNVIEYRRDVEEATDEIAPVQPQGFLRLLAEATREEAQRLGGLARDGAVDDGEDEIEAEVTELTERMDLLDSLLRESDEDTITVLSLLLETNYAQEINRLRRLEEEYREGLADSAHETIDDIIDRLQEIDVARQYFKSIYLQQELSSLSRLLLYIGLPAVATAVGSLLFLTVPADEPGALSYPAVFLPVSLTIGFSPLVILCSYILRMATVTNLTAATLPFTTPEQER